MPWSQMTLTYLPTKSVDARALVNSLIAAINAVTWDNAA